ncbi:MAG: SDR family NAD(P)-dependent oxidoreductase [Sphingobium sp.]
MSQDFLDRYGPAALVTGASSGIGRSFATELAARGFDLVLAARRVDRLEELATRLTEEYGVSVTVQAADLADPADVRALIETTAAQDIGLVVSNAGFGLKGPFEADDPAIMSEVVMVNAHATMMLAHGFVPRLRARGRGGIIFTSSVEGLIGCPYSAVYSASKAFVNALGEALWAELTPGGIEVLTLCPGATETEAAAKQGIDPATMTNQQSPDEVARLALDNIANGPTYLPHPHYRATFDQLLAMPRREALTAMANGMKR